MKKKRKVLIIIAVVLALLGAAFSAFYNLTKLEMLGTWSNGAVSFKFNINGTFEQGNYLGKNWYTGGTWRIEKTDSWPRHSSEILVLEYKKLTERYYVTAFGSMFDLYHVNSSGECGKFFSSYERL